MLPLLWRLFDPMQQLPIGIVLPGLCWYALVDVGKRGATLCGCLTLGWTNGIVDKWDLLLPPLIYSLILVMGYAVMDQFSSGFGYF
jgi:hypothetical protein